MAQQKEILIKINVDDKSLDQLSSELKGVGAEINEINKVGNQLTIDQKFQAADGAIKLFTGAVAAAVGAIGLLGIESKVFEQYEKYALGAIAFSRGIFDLSEGFKRLRQSTVLANIATQANNALNIATTVTMRALGIATNTTSVAFKGLKVAIASTGIGLLVVGIGVLVEKLMALKSANDDAAKGISDLNKQLAIQTSNISDEVNKRKFFNELEINNLKLLGKTEEEILEKRQQQRFELTEFIRGEQARLSNELLSAERNLAIATKKGNEETIKDRQEQVDAVLKLIKDFGKQANEIAEEGILDRSNFEVEQYQKQKQDQEAANEKLLELKKEFNEDLLRLTTLSVEQQRNFAIEQATNEYEDLKVLARQFGGSLEEIEKNKNIALQTLKDQFRDEDLQALQDEFNREFQIRTELQNLRVSQDDAEISRLETQVEATQGNAEKRFQLLKAQYDQEVALLNQAVINQSDIYTNAFETGAINAFEYQTLLTQIEKTGTEERAAIDERDQQRRLMTEEQINDAILQSKLSLYSQIGAAFGNLSQLFEQGTAAAKQAALAEVAINTAVGFVQALDIAQKGAAGTGPAAPFAFPIFYASQIAAVLGAAVQAKNILSTSRSGGTTSGVAETGAPGRAFQQGPTVNQGLFDFEALPQGEIVSAPRVEQRTPIRAYVLAQDVQTETEARDRLNLKRNLT